MSTLEVKWSEKPDIHDARHILKFIQEYPCANAFIVCQTPRRYKLSENITAIPWQELKYVFSQFKPND